MTKDYLFRRALKAAGYRSKIRTYAAACCCRSCTAADEAAAVQLPRQLRKS